MSRNYYNEFNKEKAEWLRQLIAVEVLAPGDVDERSILDVRPGDLVGYTQCHFFAGIGIWPFALRAAGWPDSRHVWTGSCPCQPFSAAGKRGGFDDERHLWPAWFQLIAQCRPVEVFGEQVASKDGLDWFDLVHTDLEAAGYTVGATDLCAAGFGAPHIRQRMFFVADSGGEGLPTRESPAVLGAGRGFEGRAVEQRSGAPVFWKPVEWIQCNDGKARPVEPGSFPLAHGAPARVLRLRGYGDGIVAPVAQAFIEAVMTCE